MTPRDTRTGGVLEQMVLPALRQGDYHYRKGVYIDHRPGGARHRLDVLAWQNRGDTFLVSLKWQEVSGTAEQKVPFEVISLAEAVLSGPRTSAQVACEDCGSRYTAPSVPVSGRVARGLLAYLVLGGPGWSLRDFYVGGGLSRHLRYHELVHIVSLEDFVAKANQGRL